MKEGGKYIRKILNGRENGWGKHILRTIKKDGREWQYHATKGWRNYRLNGE